MKASLSTIPVMATLLLGLANPSSGQDVPPPPAAPPPPEWPAPPPPAASSKQANQYAQYGARNSGTSGRTLISTSRDSVAPVVINFATTNGPDVEAAEADLVVMTRIIEKALDGELGEEQAPEAMGIPLVVTRGGRSVRALQLEGWGALFMIKVNFPLLPPPKAAEKKPESAATSEWENARREVQEQEGENEVRWEVKRGGGAEYDEEQMEALKKTLLAALKQATHIRHLKPEDFVAVSVFGSPISGGGTTTISRKSVSRKAGANVPAPPPPPEPLATEAAPPGAGTAAPAAEAEPGKARARVGSKTTGSAIAAAQQQAITELNTVVVEVGRAMANVSSQNRRAAGQGTVLTLRVKKADVDAFAKGSLTFEAFQKRATINAYNGSGHGITSVSSWIEKRF